MTKLIFYQNNSAEIVLPGVTDKDTGSLISNATVTATLYNPDGTVVNGYSNMSMSPVTGTPGSYNCYIPSTFNIPTGSYYFIFSGTAGVDGFSLKQPVEVKIRT